MRLLARVLSSGGLSIVEKCAAADLVIAEAATMGLVKAVSPARLPEVEPTEDPSPLSEYLEGRWLRRGRRERLPIEAGS